MSWKQSSAMKMSSATWERLTYMGFIYTYDKQDFDTAKPYWDKLLKLDPQNKLANNTTRRQVSKPGESH